MSIISPDDAKKIRKMQLINFAATMLQVCVQTGHAASTVSQLASQSAQAGTSRGSRHLSNCPSPAVLPCCCCTVCCTTAGLLPGHHPDCSQHPVQGAGRPGGWHQRLLEHRVPGRNPSLPGHMRVSGQRRGRGEVCVDRQGKAMEAADITGDRGVETGMCVCVEGLLRPAVMARTWTRAAAGDGGAFLLACGAGGIGVVCSAVWVGWGWWGWHVLGSSMAAVAEWGKGTHASGAVLLLTQSHHPSLLALLLHAALLLCCFRYAYSLASVSIFFGFILSLMQVGGHGLCVCVCVCLCVCVCGCVRGQGRVHEGVHVQG